MGIYLGQLPPAEVARLKAELAEAIIANFCYPRFFDYRTESLRMRPVDRAKRQEVWLFLSSVDFTAWSRVDLLSSDFQRHIERLFIQFVQRNRSFFGEQGRKRMPDVRMLITSSSTSVVQGLRGHITGQRQERQGTLPFGSPRPAITWSSATKNGRPEINWEQVASSTVLLQQQLQEVRGEVKTAVPNEVQSAATTGGAARRNGRSASSPEQNGMLTQQRQHVPPSESKYASQRGNHTTTTSPLQGPKRTTPLDPASLPGSTPLRTSTYAAPAASAAPSTPARKQDVADASAPITPTPVPTKSTGPIGVSLSEEQAQGSTATFATTPTSPVPVVSSASPAMARSLPQAAPPPSPVTAPDTVVTRRENRENTMMMAGEDDIAIFEQMRHQLIIWLRVEAIHSGLEIAGQGPSQLLEMLRHQDRFDETRLQVVSTLLNLTNQVIKNGQVSVLDYKQALMFHLMHTRR